MTRQQTSENPNRCGGFRRSGSEALRPEPSTSVLPLSAKLSGLRRRFTPDTVTNTASTIVNVQRPHESRAATANKDPPVLGQQRFRDTRLKNGHRRDPHTPPRGPALSYYVTTDVSYVWLSPNAIRFWCISSPVTTVTADHGVTRIRTRRIAVWLSSRW